MTRMGGFDGEIGRGRRDDSSSSRESSPQPPKKRSFSPASDDGDTEMPPVDDDDTPPPPERPIIRQAVAFAAMPTNTIINTYEASLPPAASKTYFLPGQAVPANHLRPQTKSGKSRRQGKSKKAGHEYSAQTGRFRLETYDPTPSAGPPIHHGDGPYASLFRGASGQTPRAISPATSQGGHPSVSTVVSGSEMSSVHVSRRKLGEVTKTKSSRGKQPQFQAKSAQVSGRDQAHEVSQRHRSSTPATSSSGHSSKTVRSPYYRHDYGANTPEPTTHDVHAASPSMSMSGARQQPFQTQPLVSEHNQAASTQGSPMQETGKQMVNVTEVNGVKKVVKHPLRMVTLLIQDIRSGVTDHQLVEVKVPLRTAEDPRDGYWADAKELIENWQASPARIDGPAKVYTLRGKYRQFFLRVTAENVDEYISANIVVNPDRTVDVVVEHLHPPGVPPLPPKIPRDLQSPSPEPEVVDAEQLWNLAELSRRRPEERAHEISSPSRKRRASPSFDNYREMSDVGGDRGNASSMESQRPSSTSGPPPSKRPSLGGSAFDQNQSHGHTAQDRAHHHLSTRPKVDRRGYDSPLSDDELDVVHKTICKAVDVLIQKDGEWKNYFKTRAKPSTASNMVTQYQFVQRMMDKYVGQVAPFRSKRDFLIEKSHITGALLIEDERYSSDCTETLQLLALYGKGGSRCEDPGVIDLLNDNSQPRYNAKPIKRILHMLRELDSRWKSEHMDDHQTGSNSSS